MNKRNLLQIIDAKINYVTEKKSQNEWFQSYDHKNIQYPEDALRIECEADVHRIKVAILNSARTGGYWAAKEPQHNWKKKTLFGHRCGRLGKQYTPSIIYEFVLYKQKVVEINCQLGSVRTTNKRYQDMHEGLRTLYEDALGVKSPKHIVESLMMWTNHTTAKIAEQEMLSIPFMIQNPNGIYVQATPGEHHVLGIAYSSATKPQRSLTGFITNTQITQLLRKGKPAKESTIRRICNHINDIKNKKER